MDICAHWFTKVKKQSKAMKNIVLDLNIHNIKLFCMLCAMLAFP